MSRFAVNPFFRSQGLLLHRFRSIGINVGGIRGARRESDLGIASVGFVLIDAFDDVVLFAEREFGTGFNRERLRVEEPGYADGFSGGIGFEVCHLSFFIARLGNFRGAVSCEGVDDDPRPRFPWLW